MNTEPHPIAPVDDNIKLSKSVFNPQKLYAYELYIRVAKNRTNLEPGNIQSKLFDSQIVCFVFYHTMFASKKFFFSHSFFILS